jgi:hypothetical protein
MSKRPRRFTTPPFPQRGSNMDRAPGTTLHTLMLCAIIAMLAACTTYNHPTAQQSAEAAKIRSENQASADDGILPTP